MRLTRNPSWWQVDAPAKLNLFLEVVRRRDDGFHEIETLVAPISLYDTIRCRVPQLSEPANTALTCRWSTACGLSPSESFGELPPPENNLAYRAVELLRARMGVAKPLRLELIKRIPAAAGLGGASADAAAALLAANAVWNLNLTRDQLHTLAAELGSDVPLFLSSGAAVCRGRGERITPTRSAPLWFVVVRPPQGLSTPEVYRRCQPAETNAASPLRRAELACKALAAGDARALGKAMWNRLTQPASELTPWIDRLQTAFARLHAPGHAMSGSGSSYFAVCYNKRHAQSVADRVRSQNLGHVFCTHSLAGR